MNKIESLKLTKENIKPIKMAVKRLFGLTNDDLEYRKFFIEVKEPSKAEDIVITNDYRDSECGMLDGKKHVTFYFCNKDFTTIKDEGTIHVRHDNVEDKYLNRYNINLSDAIFVVLYEVFDFNEIGDYVAEIYPLI